MLGLVGWGGWLAVRAAAAEEGFLIYFLPSLIFAGIRCVRARAKSAAGCGDSMSGFYDLLYMRARRRRRIYRRRGESDTCTQSVKGKFTNFAK